MRNVDGRDCPRRGEAEVTAHFTELKANAATTRSPKFRHYLPRADALNNS